MMTLGICLILATAAPHQNPNPTFIPVQQFTLAWMHSIEKVRWEEDYAVQANSKLGHPPVLHALEARVRGSAAGMEPPDGAVLRDGWYAYTPQFQSPQVLRLTRSEFTPDYELCALGRCRPLSDWLPSDGGVTELTACLGAER